MCVCVCVCLYNIMLYRTVPRYAPEIFITEIITMSTLSS